MYIVVILLYFNLKLNINCIIYIFYFEKIWLLFVVKRLSKIGFYNEIYIIYRIYIIYIINIFDVYIL